MARRSNQKQAKQSGSLLWLFLLIVLLTGLGLFGLYSQIDRRVLMVIQNRNYSSVPVILSDALRISAALQLDTEQLIEQLDRRGYSQVENEPMPGQYRQVAPSIFEIRTRSFIESSGASSISEHVLINTNNFEFKHLSLPARSSFYLEPEIVASLAGQSHEAKKFVALSKLPKRLVQAVIAIEDERFIKHLGIDPIGILRAMLTNLSSLSFKQGASTITQQLAKNLVLTPRKTLSRKFLEALAAISLEQHLSKERILELYLNEIYLGQEGSVAIHGMGEASESLFGREVQSISTSEAALLAGIIKGPSYYSPRKHLERALERRDMVLSRMFELKFIDADEYRSALKERINIIPSPKYKRRAPFFVQAVTSELNRLFGGEGELSAGMTIHSSLSMDMQNCAEQALIAGIAQAEQKNPKLRSQLEGAIVSIEPFSGKIRAWVGGRDFSEQQFDHVSQAKRQIGSTIKPFLYLTALDSRLNDYRVGTPISLVSDEPISIDLVTKDTWQPENFDKGFRGDVTFREALEQSLNMPAVYISQRVGVNALARTLRLFRVTHNPPEVPALALGAADTSLLELTNAYAPLANSGIFVPAQILRTVLDGSNSTVFEASQFEERVASDEAVYVLTDMLAGVLSNGTGRSIRAAGFDAPAAGKTGTSNQNRDAWFVGYTPNLVTGVWIGRDDNLSFGLTGGAVAAPIWADYMKCVTPFHERLDFVQPAGVVRVKIDQQSGGLATPGCPSENIRTEVFIRGTEPIRGCAHHMRYNDSDASEDYRLPESATRPDSKPRQDRRSLWDVLFG